MKGIQEKQLDELIEHAQSIQLLGSELGRRAQEWAEIKATLILNCEDDRAIGKLGIKYNESHRVVTNLAMICEKLIDMANKQQ